MKSLLLALALLSPAGAIAQPALTPAQTQRLAAHIMDADTNGDGMVTRPELMAWRAVQFERFDRNGDGYLDDKDAPLFAFGAHANLDQALTAFDVDRDGRVDRTEFSAGPSPVFDQADLDHNNVLDPYELKRLKEG